MNAMKKRFVDALAFGGIALMAACGAPGMLTGSSGVAAGGQVTGPGSGGATSGSVAGSVNPVCDEMALEATHVAPNLMFVVDASGSMNEYPNDDPNQVDTKIDLTRKAVGELLQAGQGNIRFGWEQFPGNGGRCSAGQVQVECSDTSSATIQSKLGQLSSDSFGTPTGESLLNVLQSQSMQDKTRSNFVVLLTDGMPNCPQGNESGAEALALQAVQQLRVKSIETFVIGLGQSLNSSNPALLDQLAEAGGRARVGAANKYYAVNTLSELQGVLTSIGGVVFQCSFALQRTPENPGDLRVNFDGVSVARDPSAKEGFSYDPQKNQILIHGAACEKVRAGQVKKVDIKMGCAPPA